MTGDTARRVRILIPRSADTFPTIEIEAAIPAWIVSDDALRAPVSAFEPDVAARWAELLSAELPTHAYAVRSLEANDEGWTHWLRLVGNEGDAPFADFIVRARGLPASEAEARAHGYERAEFIVARLPLPARGESLN